MCLQKTQVPLVEDLFLEPSIITHSWFSSSNSKVVWILLKDLLLGKEKSQSLFLPIVTSFLLEASKVCFGVVDKFYLDKLTTSKTLFSKGLTWNMIFPAEIISFCLRGKLYPLVNLIYKILLSLFLLE